VNPGNNAYTVQPGDFTVLCNFTVSAKNVTLPAAGAPNVGRVINVRRIGGSQACNVVGADAAVSLGNGEAITVQSDGTTWWRIAHL
jgi:hypothetical protein